jgi:hypothetical protein
MTPLIPCSLTALLLAALVAGLSSCASPQQTAGTPRPGNGISEFQHLTRQSHHAVQRALDALDEVSRPSDGCSPKMLARFSKEIHRLETGSIRIRARAQAMRERGEAYFQNWHANLARIPDPAIRALADLRRPELQQHFNQATLLAQDTRASFQLFLAGLRNIRNALEKDLHALQTEPNQDRVRATREHGHNVERGLAAIDQEFQDMRTLVTPKKTAALP